MTSINIDKILQLAPSPAYVVDLGRLRANLAVLDEVQKRSGAKILLALKGFAMWSVFPIIRETLHGVCASSPWEARLGREEFGREVHSFSPGLRNPMLLNCWRARIIWYSTPSTRWSGSGRSGRSMQAVFP